MPSLANESPNFGNCLRDALDDGEHANGELPTKAAKAADDSPIRSVNARSDSASDKSMIDGLTLYDMHRLPRETIVDDRISTCQLSVLSPELTCYLCEGPFNRPYAAMECLHRFCFNCISKYIRVGKKECPKCHIKLASTRVMRPDVGLETIVKLFYPSQPYKASVDPCTEKKINATVERKSHNVSSSDGNTDSPWTPPPHSQTNNSHPLSQTRGGTPKKTPPASLSGTTHSNKGSTRESRRGRPPKLIKADFTPEKQNISTKESIKLLASLPECFLSPETSNLRSDDVEMAPVSSNNPDAKRINPGSDRSQASTAVKNYRGKKKDENKMTVALFPHPHLSNSSVNLSNFHVVAPIGTTVGHLNTLLSILNSKKYTIPDQQAETFKFVLTIGDDVLDKDLTIEKIYKQFFREVHSGISLHFYRENNSSVQIKNE
ncbi:uncharacterized protein LOC126311200 [Schistocerca gregaria]|uniref:uncharacterized protein LOC126311200 n=1 Tax=Schistocerca gregaria TaxID=7010 RepID=UPI00211EDF2A|nr:uncharacterized protein LOC126311200 [Schistocerca gregaria]